MKVLYIGRLFSGLEQSLRDGVWRPTGVPTVYKMLEALDRGPYSLEIVLTEHDYPDRDATGADRIVRLEGLRTPIRIMGMWRGARRNGLLSSALSELRRLIRLLGIVRRSRPDIVYIGNANIWTAGVIARLFGTPVVFRLMGVYPAMWKILERRDVAARVQRWCYRAPYAAVIATQDGSGVEEWTRRACRRGVPVRCLVNGVEFPEPSHKVEGGLPEIPADKTVVLFIGHLEPLKGCMEFVRAFLAARAEVSGALHAVIVGRGYLRRDIDHLIDDEDAAEDIVIIDRVAHEQIAALHRRSDIYVSLNRQGNLSNANLEAMKLGQCMILSAMSDMPGTEDAERMVIPADAARWIPFPDDVDALREAIIDLHRNPEVRQAYREKALQAAEALPSWQHRIETELSLLRDICIREQAA